MYGDLFNIRERAISRDYTINQQLPNAIKNLEPDRYQLHYSYVAHQIGRLVDHQQIMMAIQTIGPTAYNLIVKKQSVDQIRGTQSGYGFVSFPTFEDCQETVDKLKRLTVYGLTFDCAIANRSLEPQRQYERSQAASYSDYARSIPNVPSYPPARYSYPPPISFPRPKNQSPYEYSSRSTHQLEQQHSCYPPPSPSASPLFCPRSCPRFSSPPAYALTMRSAFSFLSTPPAAHESKS